MISQKVDIQILSYMNNNFIKIKEFYEKADQFIQNECLEEAKCLIYNDMPIKYYDISLNLLNNRNLSLNEQNLNLQKLIDKVLKRLDRYEERFDDSSIEYLEQETIKFEPLELIDDEDPVFNEDKFDERIINKIKLKKW